MWEHKTIKNIIEKMIKWTIRIIYTEIISNLTIWIKYHFSKSNYVNIEHYVKGCSTKIFNKIKKHAVVGFPTKNNDETSSEFNGNHETTEIKLNDNNR